MSSNRIRYENLVARGQSNYRRTLGALVLGVLFAAQPLQGCGGGGSTTGTTLTRTGTASLSIEWPEESRLIPIASKSITLTFYNGTTQIATQTVTRPTDGNTSTVSFPALPVGQLTLIANAYPSTQAAGTIQATATSPVIIIDGQTVAVALTLESTISSLTASPTKVNILSKQTSQLSVYAINSVGSIVVTAASTFTYSSSNTSVATVSSSGLVTGTGAGTASVTITETESGKFAIVPITVTASGGADVTIN